MHLLHDSQIFIVVDIESDGPAPGLHSMLSIGAVATTETEEVGRFYKKLQPLDDASRYPATMEWWATEPDAWNEVTTDTESANDVMDEFVEWIKSFSKEPVFVAHPVAFDYSMVSWYLWKFANYNPFVDERRSPRALDISSFISGKYDMSLNDSTRNHLPDWMMNRMPEHSHNALDDAVGYGVILRNVINKNFN